MLDYQRVKKKKTAPFASLPASLKDALIVSAAGASMRSCKARRRPLGATSCTSAVPGGPGGPGVSVVVSMAAGWPAGCSLWDERLQDIMENPWLFLQSFVGDMSFLFILHVFEDDTSGLKAEELGR